MKPLCSCTSCESVSGHAKKDLDAAYRWEVLAVEGAAGDLEMEHPSTTHCTGSLLRGNVLLNSQRADAHVSGFRQPG